MSAHEHGPPGTCSQPDAGGARPPSPRVRGQLPVHGERGGERGTPDLRTFWNSRAGLGTLAGTRDIIAKQLEIEAIAEHVCDGQRVLDLGCGNGATAIELAGRYRVDVTGLDFAAELIDAARTLEREQSLKGSVRFLVGDLRCLPELGAPFDLVYTERTLINLPDWQSQQRAIADVAGLLAAGGLYVMCENSQDGLDRLNALRERVGLPNIEPPWHNRYLRDAEVERLAVPGLSLEGVRSFSSTYYLLSRVINAWLSAQEGQEPDYDSPINRLALRLPPIGDVGQGRIWLWRKVDAPGESRTTGDA